MPLEIGNYIGDLDASWPLGGDPTNQGDDHLRLIKAILQSQFPGELGAGFATAITANEDELNSLDGLDVTTWPVLEDRLLAIEASITALTGELSAPQGTKMVFLQAAAPNGWTQETTNNDFMLRIVNTAGGATGGTDSPIANDILIAHSHTFSGTTASMNRNASHGHSVSTTWGQSCAASSGCYGGGVQGSCNPVCYTNNSYHTALSTNTNHEHTFSGTTANAGSGTGWRPQYIDTIVGVKD